MSCFHSQATPRGRVDGRYDGFWVRRVTDLEQHVIVNRVTSCGSNPADSPGPVPACFCACDGRVPATASCVSCAASGGLAIGADHKRGATVRENLVDERQDEPIVRTASASRSEYAPRYNHSPRSHRQMENATAMSRPPRAGPRETAAGRAIGGVISPPAAAGHCNRYAARRSDRQIPWKIGW